MDVVKITCLFFMLKGTVHAKRMQLNQNVCNEGENATLYIGETAVKLWNIHELNFSVYTSKANFTIESRVNLSEATVVNNIYTGRVKMNDGNTSVILLGVTFMDSGNFTVLQNSLEKTKSIILIAENSFLGQYSDSTKVPFLCNITKASSIEINNNVHKHHFVKLNETGENCTKLERWCIDRIQSCVSRGIKMSATILNTSSCMYGAQDKINCPIGSVRIDIEGTSRALCLEPSNQYDDSKYIPNISTSVGHYYMLESIILPAVFTMATAYLIIITWRKHRHKRSTLTTNITNQGRGNINPCNMYQRVDIVHTPEGKRMILRENSASYNVTDFIHSQNQIDEKENVKHIYANANAGNVHIDTNSRPSSGNLSHDPVPDYDNPMNNYKLDQRRPCSNLPMMLTDDISDQSSEYYNIVQHNNMPLKLLKTGYVVNERNKKKVTVDHSSINHTSAGIQSLSIIASIVLGVDCKQHKSSEFHLNDSRLWPRRNDSRKQLCLLSSNKFKRTVSVDSMDSPSFSPHGHYQNIQSASQTFGDDFVGSESDHSFALKRGYRRSRSCGALYQNQMFASKI